MKNWLMAATVGAVLLGAGVAVAQAPSPPPPPGPMSGPEGGPGGEMGPGGHHFGGMRGMHRPPPSKAARFMFRKGDAVVAIKCADDEPTKACVDAGSALLDKLAAQQPK